MDSGNPYKKYANPLAIYLRVNSIDAKEILPIKFIIFYCCHS